MLRFWMVGVVAPSKFDIFCSLVRGRIKLGVAVSVSFICEVNNAVFFSSLSGCEIFKFF